MNLHHIRTLLIVLVCSLSLAAQDSPLKYEWGDRDERANPEYVLKAIDLQPGQTIVDLGAGGGYFTVRFAEQVGPSGTVIATDIKQHYLDFIRDRVERSGHENVRYILAGEHIPNLTGVRADVIFLANVYHHLDQPVDYLAQTLNAFTIGGRLIVIETYRRISTHGSTVDDVVTGCREAGFELIRVDESQPRFFIAIFKPQKVAVQ